MYKQKSYCLYCRCSNIKTLNMSNTNTANDIQSASELPKLRTLNITNSQVEAIQYSMLQFLLIIVIRYLMLVN